MSADLGGVSVFRDSYQSTLKISKKSKNRWFFKVPPPILKLETRGNIYVGKIKTLGFQSQNFSSNLVQLFTVFIKGAVVSLMRNFIRFLVFYKSKNRMEKRITLKYWGRGCWIWQLQRNKWIADSESVWNNGSRRRISLGIGYTVRLKCTFRLLPEWHFQIG